MNEQKLLIETAAEISFRQRALSNFSIFFAFRGRDSFYVIKLSSAKKKV